MFTGRGLSPVALVIPGRSPGTIHSAIGPLAPRLTKLTVLIDNYSKQYSEQQMVVTIFYKLPL